MKVTFPNMTIDFVDVDSETEAMDHARVIIFEDVYKLPAPYKLVREDEVTQTFYVQVY